MNGKERARACRVFSVALAGNPNCGKTALFNALTGGRAKVGNYPGVTVERKEASIVLPSFNSNSGNSVRIFDLPGTYSLHPRSPDEEVTRQVLMGTLKGESAPDLIIGVVDATNLARSLGLILELRALGKPMILALNMMDLAQKNGLDLDLARLSSELAMKLVPTIAIQKIGISELLKEVEEKYALFPSIVSSLIPSQVLQSQLPQPKATQEEIKIRFQEVDRILACCTRKNARPTLWTDRIDHFVLHPVWGSLLLFGVLGFVFQAIFTWAQIPMDWIKAGIESFSVWVRYLLPAGPLQSLIVDGMIAGVGSVLVFLPQILLLFLFILLLEDSGYLSRAAFLMDRMMGKVGLHGRAFIPLLSSFACAIPGIMATRTIENRRDRLITILVAPLMTCSARLPVYSLLIAAFIPNRQILGPIRLQGLVMFGLYLAGMFLALTMSVVFKKTILKGSNPPLLMELPTYKWPSLRNIFVGLLERAQLFIQKAGTVILSISVILWFLASYPKPPLGANEPAILYSYAGRMGHFLAPVVEPIGFNWKIAIALIPGFAAREIMIGSLATVYAVEGSQGLVPQAIGTRLAQDWSIATALSLLVWYVLACQCLSTLAVTRRETNSWKWPGVMLVYMTALAYLGSFLTYQISLRFGLGGL